MLVPARYHILEMHIVGLVFYRIPPIKRRIFHRTWGPVQLAVERKGFPTLKQTSHGRSLWVELLVRVLASDGIGGHTGPFVGRELFGSAWYQDVGNPAIMVARTKWSGNFAPTCP
jgi:hypothetical protein